MVRKSVFLIIFFLSLLSVQKAKEIKIEKIRNVILSIIQMNSVDIISSFSFKYKQFLLKFINFAYFDSLTKYINFLQDDNDKSKYILNNLTIVFKSQLEINKMNTTNGEFLLEVYFDKIIFNNKSDFIKVEEVIPRALFISKYSQIGQLSYFNDFNKLEKAIYLDENGKKFENVDIVSTFLEIAKKLLLKKITNVQNKYNLLTYDFDQIFNNIIGKYITCGKIEVDVLKISSIFIENIDIDLKSIYIENKQLIIENMTFYGNFFYTTEYKLMNFSFYYDKNNSAYFEQGFFDLNLNVNKINYDGKFPTKQNIYEALKYCLSESIKEEINKYYS